jgi:hypothetical protein
MAFARLVWPFNRRDEAKAIAKFSPKKIVESLGLLDPKIGIHIVDISVSVILFLEPLDRLRFQLVFGHHETRLFSLAIVSFITITD